MKTDRELLELAAKAAGLRFAINGDDLPGYVAVAGDDWRYGWTHWNPLTDDGDALRLAVKLNVMFDFIKSGFMSGNVVAVCEQRGAYEPREPDPYAATRRAVTRAAAEIGSQS